MSARLTPRTTATATSAASTTPSARPTVAADSADIAAMRRFNRFYTRHLGLLDESLLGSGLGLTEARVIYELGQGTEFSASALAQALQLDAGYLSRLLTRLQARKLLRRSADSRDARVQRLQLSKSGEKVFEALDRASREQLWAQTAHLAAADRRELLASMASLERLLEAPAAAGAAAPVRAGRGEVRTFILRDPQPGDMGWVVHRQALLYAQEYGWDGSFEALLAEIVAGFVRSHDPQHERCWIAERGHRIVGSIFLVRESALEAKLRLLYVEAEVRGLGVGASLVDECIRTARAKGYRRLTLWTNDVLVAARRIYQNRGFTLVKEEPHHSFGKDLVGQYWALEL